MRVLVVEDDPALAKLAKQILCSHGYSVDLAETGEAVLQLIDRSRYDIVVLDLMLPGIDGFEVVRKMRIAGNDTPVLILSGITRAPDKVTGLKLGADDYLTKPFEPSELIARIEAVIRRNRIIWNPPLCVGPVTLHQGNREVSAAGKPIHLTRTEYAVLEALATGKGMLHTKEGLMRHIYGGIDEPDSQTIDVLVCRLRRKLNEAGVSGFIKTVWGQGYMVPSQLAHAALPVASMHPLKPSSIGMVDALLLWPAAWQPDEVVGCGLQLEYLADVRQPAMPGRAIPAIDLIWLSRSGWRGHCCSNRQTR